MQADVLDLSALDAVRAYEPAELVLTAAAATPLAAVEELLAGHGQRLAFAPPCFSRLLAAPARQTLGGVLAANLAGSRRVVAGAARDHFLGFEAVSGRGERFRAGGKVVKNVTGYDLPKLLAGSWGTLGVLTEVTIRVAPAPETECTLRVPCDGPERAVALLSAALGSPHDVSSAAFDPRLGCCLLRVEGFASSVAARVAALLKLIGHDAGVEQIGGDASRDLWIDVGDGAALAEWPFVWRISVPPSDAARVVAAVAPDDYLLDWGGGAILAGQRALDAARVRTALREGHATLIKAPLEARRATPVFQPLPAGVAALAQRVKAAFDPVNKLNPGRLG